jgi:hypothetical protein
MNLEDVLRKLQPDRGNLLHGRLLEMGCGDQRPYLGTMMPQRGLSTPSLQFRRLINAADQIGGDRSAARIV